LCQHHTSSAPGQSAVTTWQCGSGRGAAPQCVAGAREATRCAAVGRHRARRRARAGAREHSLACHVSAWGWRGLLPCGGGHGGGLADRGLGRVASARWPGDVGSLVLAARPGLARFFLFCSVSVPNHMVQARFKALGSGFHSVFFSTTSGTFPACYSVVGVGLGAGKRGRSSTLPLLLPL
jgi:hypothetical protein